MSDEVSPAAQDADHNDQAMETQLSRTMGLTHVVMIGVGAMIGAGIFVLTGIAAGVAGPALILVFLLNGLVTTLTALSYAELGSCFPEAGGGYLWVQQALPRPNGFLSGWMSWFAHAVACSLYAAAFGAFATKVLSLAPGLGFLEDNSASVKTLAVLITIVFAYINFRGAGETGRAETVVTTVKIVVIALFCFAGLWAIIAHRPNLQANFSDLRSFVPTGLSGIAVAMGLTFVAFEGYEIIAQCGEEVRNPKRNIPLSIFISIAIVIPIYMLVAFVAIAGVNIPEGYTGAATTNWQYLGELKELALIDAADAFMPLGGLIFLTGGIFSTMSALNATIYSSSRVSFAMGRDHNFPAVFAKIHRRRRTPYVATAISSVLIIVMAVALPIEDVASATDAMFLLLFVMVNLAVINLRRNRPDLERGFRVPWVPWIPLAAILSNLVLAGFLFWHYRLGVGITFGYIGAGIIVYLLYSRRKEEKAKAVPTVYRETPSREEEPFRILTPIANPRSIPGLMTLSRILAMYKRAEIIVAHVLQVPSQLPPSAAQDLLDESKELIHKARRVRFRAQPARGGAKKPEDEKDDSPGPPPIAALVKVSHNIALAIGDTIREEHVDLLVLGWRGGAKRRDYFFGNILDNTVSNAECDVVMMVRPAATFLDKAKRLLVPILIDYRSARLSLQIALALGSFGGLPVETIHVSEKHETEAESVREAFEAAAEELSKSVDLSAVKQKILHARNVYGTLLTEIRPTDVIVIEGCPEKILSRTFFGEIPERLAQELTNHVILTKKYPGPIFGWFQKFFGTRKPQPYSE